MNEAWYKRTPEREMVGRKVKLLKAITIRDGTTAPAGTICTIKRKFRGLWLQAPPCPHCGISFQVIKVPPYEVQLIKEESGA